MKPIAPTFVGQALRCDAEQAVREYAVWGGVPRYWELRELGFINKEVPFGESEKKSKKGLYRISDPLLCFHYRYVLPYRSLIELDNSAAVLDVFKKTENEYVSMVWEIV